MVVVNCNRPESFRTFCRPPLSLSEICWRSGDLSRVSRKGKTPPLERGRGNYSPPANPERVTSKASKRRDKGGHLPKTFSLQLMGYKNTQPKLRKFQ